MATAAQDSHASSSSPPSSVVLQNSRRRRLQSVVASSPNSPAVYFQQLSTLVEEEGQGGDHAPGPEEEKREDEERKHEHERSSPREVKNRYDASDTPSSTNTWRSNNATKTYVESPLKPARNRNGDVEERRMAARQPHRPFMDAVSGPLMMRKYIDDVKEAATRKVRSYEEAVLRIQLAHENKLLHLAGSAFGAVKTALPPPAPTTKHVRNTDYPCDGTREDEVPPSATHQHLQISHMQLDKVPLNVRRLNKTLLVLDVSFNDLVDVPKVIGELYQLRRLHAEHNMITHFAPEVSQCTSLARLYAHGNRLSTVATWMCRLPNLETFTFGDNAHLAPPFGALANLSWSSTRRFLLFKQHIEGMSPMEEQLNFAQQSLDFVPEFPQLRILVDVDLSCNSLGSVPSCVAHVQSLETINVEDNRVLPSLPILPPSLRVLRARGNAIGDVLGEENILRMRELEYLDLSNNAITGCMPSLVPCRALRELYLNDNQLEALCVPSAAGGRRSAPSHGESAVPMRRQRSGGVGYLRPGSVMGDVRALPDSLEVFHAHANALTGDLGSVFAEPYSFPGLREISLSRNRITRIDANGAGLPALETLHLAHNRLLDIPDGLQHCTSLRLLEVHNNVLDCVPEWLGDLVSSGMQNDRKAAPGEHRHSVLAVPNFDQEVEIVRNTMAWGVEEINGRICLNCLGLFLLPDLSRFARTLKTLLVSNNQLIALPRALCSLTTLSRLDASQNDIPSLPSTFGDSLTSLQTLYLHNNRLSALDEDDLAGLTMLESLNCSHNPGLTEFPFIYECRSLKTLVVTHTNIEEIGMDISELDHLENVFFDENPKLIWPPPEVMRRGNKEALEFLKELHAREMDGFFSSSQSSSARTSFDATSSFGGSHTSRRLSMSKRRLSMLSTASIASSAKHASDAITVPWAARGTRRTARQRWDWMRKIYFVFHKIWVERKNRLREKFLAAMGKQEDDRLNEAEEAGANLAMKRRGRRTGMVSATDVNTAMTELSNKSTMKERQSEIIEELFEERKRMDACREDMRKAVSELEKAIAKEEDAAKIDQAERAKRDNFEQYRNMEEAVMQRQKEDTDNIAQKKHRQRRRKSLAADAKLFAVAAKASGDKLQEVSYAREIAFGKLMSLKEQMKRHTETVQRLDRDKVSFLFLPLQAVVYTSTSMGTNLKVKNTTSNRARQFGTRLGDSTSCRCARR